MREISANLLTFDLTHGMTTATQYNPELAQHVGKAITDPTLPKETYGYYPVVDTSAMTITGWAFADDTDFEVVEEHGGYMVAK